MGPNQYEIAAVCVYVIWGAFCIWRCFEMPANEAMPFARTAIVIPGGLLIGYLIGMGLISYLRAAAI